MDACHCADEDDVAAGALPAAMSSQPPLVGTDVNLANVSLTDGMKPMLQRFCDSTTDATEKAKALELLTALELSSAIKAEALDGRPRPASARRSLTPTSSMRTGREAGDAALPADVRRWRPRTAAPRVLQQQQQQGLRQSAPSDCDTSGIECVGGDSGAGTRPSYVNSYETTHNYYYQPPQPSPSNAIRPASSQMQRVVPPSSELPAGNSFSDLFMTTTYEREYFSKTHLPPGRSEPERAASARRVRNNNPHPNQEFMVWRYRRPMTATEKIETTLAATSNTSQQASPQPNSAAATEQRPKLTNESFDRAVRGKCRSTYQHDYLGLPTDFNVNQRSISLLGVEGRAIAYDKSSMSRSAFAKPAATPPELSVPLTRFGQNPARAAPGVIPAGGLNGHAFGLKTRTTYEAHICEPASRVMRVADLRQLSNAQNAKAVAELLNSATGSERAALYKLYKEMQSRQLPVSIPMPVERRIRKERVGGHMRLSTQPAWMTSWTGPA